ncbi:MAG: hypothetical protein ABR991_04510 [Terracidiphilus sp.]|jgi:hypothetical protein
MGKCYVFPKKCCACLTECSTTRELFDSTSEKVGFHTEITQYRSSVPVCEKCQSKFGRINYGWLTWFGSVLIGAIVGCILAFAKPEGNARAVVGMTLLGGMIGLFPSMFIAVKYGHKTEAPAFLGKGDGRPWFRNEEYRRLFDELNPRE